MEPVSHESRGVRNIERLGVVSTMSRHHQSGPVSFVEARGDPSDLFERSSHACFLVGRQPAEDQRSTWLGAAGQGERRGFEQGTGEVGEHTRRRPGDEVADVAIDQGDHRLDIVGGQVAPRGRRGVFVVLDSEHRSRPQPCGGDREDPRARTDIGDVPPSERLSLQCAKAEASRRVMTGSEAHRWVDDHDGDVRRVGWEIPGRGHDHLVDPDGSQIGLRAGRPVLSIISDGYGMCDDPRMAQLLRNCSRGGGPVVIREEVNPTHLTGRADLSVGGETQHLDSVGVTVVDDGIDEVNEVNKINRGNRVKRVSKGRDIPREPNVKRGTSFSQRCL